MKHECNERCLLESGECIHDLIAVNGPMTLDQVALHWGCTRENIRQIETKAKRRFARALKRFGLTLEGLVSGADTATLGDRQQSHEAGQHASEIAA